MDASDRKILNILQKNGRCSYSEIGGAVGLSTTAVKDRIDKLVAGGILQNFSIEIAPKPAGYDVIAFVFVGIDKPEDCKRFEKMAADIPNIQECHHVTGLFNYLLKVLATDMEDLENLLTKQIKIPGIVSRTETTIVFSSVKNSSYVECLNNADRQDD